MKKPSLLLYVCWLFLSSCGKDNPTPFKPTVNSSGIPTFVHHTYYPVNSVTKAYAFFRPGTYWIYKDSTTGAIDSVFVTKLDTGRAITPTDTCEWFEVTTYSTFNKRNNVLGAHRNPTAIVSVPPNSPGTGPTYQIDSTIQLINYRDSVNIMNRVLSLYLPYNCRGLYTYAMGPYAENDITTYVLGSKMLTHVLQWTYNDGNRSFFVENYGLVRRAYTGSPSPVIWNLVRCHIIQ